MTSAPGTRVRADLAPERFGDKPLPKPAIAGLFGLALMGVVAAALGKWGGLADLSQPDVPARLERTLKFDDAPGGHVIVTDGASGAVVVDYAPGDGGFVRMVVRDLARARKAKGLGPETPFLLVERADGRYDLKDPATGERIGVDAFGKDNKAAFQRLLQD
jgi:putative photosynthetic complex assembly protein